MSRLVGLENQWGQEGGVVWRGRWGPGLSGPRKGWDEVVEKPGLLSGPCWLWPVAELLSWATDRQARASVERCSLWEQQGTRCRRRAVLWINGHCWEGLRALPPYCLPVAGAIPRVSGQLDSGESSSTCSLVPVPHQALGCQPPSSGALPQLGL